MLDSVRVFAAAAAGVGASGPAETAAVVFEDAVQGYGGGLVGAVCAAALGVQRVITMSVEEDVARRGAEVAAEVALGALVVGVLVVLDGRGALVLLAVFLALFFLFFLFLLLFALVPLFFYGVLAFVSRECSCEGADDGAGYAVAGFSTESVATVASCCCTSETAHDTTVTFWVALAAVLVLMALVHRVATRVG